MKTDTPFLICVFAQVGGGVVSAWLLGGWHGLAWSIITFSAGVHVGWFFALRSKQKEGRQS